MPRIAAGEGRFQLGVAFSPETFQIFRHLHGAHGGGQYMDHQRHPARGHAGGFGDGK